jgi:type IV secretion system protein VirD4
MMGRALWDMIKGMLKYGTPVFVWMFLSDWLIGFLPAGAHTTAYVASPLIGVGMCWFAGYFIPALRTLPMVLFGIMSVYYAVSTMMLVGDWYSVQRDAGFGVTDLMTVDVVVGLVVCAVTLLAGIAATISASPKLSQYSLGLLSAAAGKAGEMRLTRRANSDFYDAAHWLSPEKATTLCVDEEGKTTRGVLLGKVSDKPDAGLIHYPLEAHAITIAPTRTGKGVSAIIPNVLAGTAQSWEGPMIVTEPKGESWFVCERRRRELGRTPILIDPLGVIEGKWPGDPRAVSATFNPLDFVRRGEKGVADIDALMDAFFGEAGSDNQDGGGDSYFEDKARVIVPGFCAWAICNEDPANRNLIYVYELLLLPWTRPKDDANAIGPFLDEICEEMAASDAFHGLPAIAAKTLLMSRNSEKELSAIIGSCTKVLSWLKMPELRRQVMTSSFNIEDLCENKIDLFIFIPPGHLKKGSDAKRWLRMWAAIPLALVERKRPVSRVLMILDEAPAVGRLAAIVNAFQLAAGYNLSVWLFAQTLAGFRQAYGDKNVDDMLENSEFVQYLRPPSTAKPPTINDISEALGDVTMWEESTSENSGTSAKVIEVFSNRSEGTSTSGKLAKRRLMSPGDIRSMASDEMIVLHRHKREHAPIRARQARYFKLPELAGLADPNPHFTGSAPQPTPVNKAA